MDFVFTSSDGLGIDDGGASEEVGASSKAGLSCGGVADVGRESGVTGDRAAGECCEVGEAGDGCDVGVESDGRDSGVESGDSWDAVAMRRELLSSSGLVGVWEVFDIVALETSVEAKKQGGYDGDAIVLQMRPNRSVVPLYTAFKTVSIPYRIYWLSSSSG